MRFYLSGPITGIDNYRENFKEVADKLKAEGYYDVINPAELCEVMPACTSWDDYMKIDLELLAMCDVVVMLPGWEQSRGANREYGYALATDKIIWDMEG